MKCSSQLVALTYYSRVEWTVERCHSCPTDPLRKTTSGISNQTPSRRWKDWHSCKFNFFVQSPLLSSADFETSRSVYRWISWPWQRNMNLFSCPNVHTFQQLVLQRSPRLESESYQRATGAEKVGRDGKWLASQQTDTTAEQPHDCGRSAPVAMLSGLLSVQDDVRWRQLFVLERPLAQFTDWLVVAWWNPIRQGAGLHQTRVLSDVPLRR